MKVIAIGSANMEVLLSRDSLPRAMTGEDPLDRFSGGKFDLARYRCLLGEGLNRYTLFFKKGVKGRGSVMFTAPSATRFSPGGSALSIALGLAGVGAEAKVITALTDAPHDFFSAVIREYAEERSVQFLSVFSRPVTPVSFIIWGLPEGDERSVVLAYKPPYTVRQKAIEVVLKALRAEVGITHVVAAGTRQVEELPLVARAFEIGLKQGAVTCFTPNASLLSKRHTKLRQQLKGVFVHTTILQINEQEAAIYLGIGRRRLLQSDIEALAGQTKVPITIVTRSARGAAAVIDGKYHEIPAFPPPRIQDTSGAGDAFTVGFLFGHDRACSSLECLQLGAYSASGNIGFPGGHAGIPNGDMLLQFLQQLRTPQQESAPATG